MRQSSIGEPGSRSCHVRAGGRGSPYCPLDERRRRAASSRARGRRLLRVERALASATTVGGSFPVRGGRPPRQRRRQAAAPGAGGGGRRGQPPGRRRRARRGDPGRRSPSSWCTWVRSTTTTSWTRPSTGGASRASTPDGATWSPSSPATSCWPGRRRSPRRSAPRWPGSWPAPSASCARARSASCGTPSTRPGPRPAYLASIAGKTASLMATSAGSGRIVGGAPRPWVDALTAYGQALGMAFQIWDDIRDLVCSDEHLGQAGRPRHGRRDLHAAGAPGPGDPGCRATTSGPCSAARSTRRPGTRPGTWSCRRRR